MACSFRNSTAESISFKGRPRLVSIELHVQSLLPAELPLVSHWRLSLHLRVRLERAPGRSTDSLLLSTVDLVVERTYISIAFVRHQFVPMSALFVRSSEHASLRTRTEEIRQSTCIGATGESIVEQTLSLRSEIEARLRFDNEEVPATSHRFRHGIHRSRIDVTLLSRGPPRHERAER